MQLLAANNAQTVLASGINASATALTVATGKGALFPVPVADTSLFKLTLTDAATESVREIMHVTSVSGDVFTVVRGQEGTAARSWSANDIVANFVTAGTLDYFAQKDSPTFIGVPKAPTASAGTSTTQLATTAFVTTAITNAGYGRFIKETPITISQTFTLQASTRMIRIRGVGTGGTGAGSASASSSACSCLSGGSAGGYAEGIWAVSGGASYIVVIGALGAQGYGNGGAGGTSTFGSIISIPGGGGGRATSVSSTTFFENIGGDGSTPTLSGQVSGFWSRGFIGLNGRAMSGFSAGGKGADSQFGSGGAGSASVSGNSAPGSSATGYGSGGGGASVAPSGGQVYGGNGSGGIFIIEEYA